MTTPAMPAALPILVTPLTLAILPGHHHFSSQKLPGAPSGYGIARSAIKVRLTHRVLPVPAVWRSEPVSGRCAPI
jgi:hypothetical protein